MFKKSWKMIENFVATAERPRLRNYLWLLVPLCLSPLHYAKAYIDPGSGSYIIQMVIGTLFGAAYVVKGAIAKAFQRVRQFLTRKPGEEKPKP
jgi:hypothetical protein